MAAPRKYKDLEARLGYSFKSRDLLKKALTHASVRQAPGKRRDNERLEFLGDRVLGLVIAELLWETYPNADEGELARLYNRLVRGRTCAAVAREMNLGPCLVQVGQCAGVAPHHAYRVAFGQEAAGKLRSDLAVGAEQDKHGISFQCG